MVELVRSGSSLGSLAKEFEPTAQMIQIWVKQVELDHLRVADIIYVPTWAGFIYLGRCPGCLQSASYRLGHHCPPRWYNPHRSHSAIDYMSPINYTEVTPVNVISGSWISPILSQLQ